MKHTVYLATDHAGFELKERVLAYLREELGYEVIDCGAEVYDQLDDYPDFISKAAAAVAEDPERRGIIFGGSGQGEAMAANRYRGVRAAVYYGGPEEIVTLSREHNNANMLSLGARFVTEAEAKTVVTKWLELSFSAAERHQRRITKLDALG